MQPPERPPSAQDNAFDQGRLVQQPVCQAACPCPPRYCTNHDRSEKRLKMDHPKDWKCSLCGVSVQTNYREFTLCAPCSDGKHRCMICGASAPRAGNYVPPPCLPASWPPIHSPTEQCPSLAPPPFPLDTLAFTPLPQLSRGVALPEPGLYEASPHDDASPGNLHSSPPYTPGAMPPLHSSSAPYNPMAQCFQDGAGAASAFPAFMSSSIAAPLPLPGPLHLPLDMQPFSGPALSIPGPLGGAVWGSSGGAISPFCGVPVGSDAKPFGGAPQLLHQHQPLQFHPLMGGG